MKYLPTTAYSIIRPTIFILLAVFLNTAKAKQDIKANERIRIDCFPKDKTEP